MKNILKNGFIIDASGELVPKISISPFHEVFRSNNNTSSIGISENYFKQRFGNYKLLTKARNAIYEVLLHFNLEKNDVVTILTTSGNFYISSCVTKEIDKICKWSREFTENTKVIFINHEFGYPMDEIDYKKVIAYKKSHPDVKIIEDCAHTFFSKSEVIGSYADYVIYSLPKSFAMQIGAVLVSQKYDLTKSLPVEYENYILSCFSNYVPKIGSYIDKQIQNYKYLKEQLQEIGITPFFNNASICKEATVPSVFLFKWKEDVDYPLLKEFMQSNGVESSVFYGKNAFFIPSNYALSKDELDYMISLLFCFNERYCLTGERK